MGMERTPSAASETEEAASQSESRQPSYTADEFLTGAGSKHAQIMRSAAIELLDGSRDFTHFTKSYIGASEINSSYDEAKDNHKNNVTRE